MAEGNKLSIWLPTDPVRAQAIKDWAAENNIELNIVGFYVRQQEEAGERYPYVCKNGHMVESSEDEFTYKNSPAHIAQGRRNLAIACKMCRRAATRRYRARKAASGPRD